MQEPLWHLKRWWHDLEGNRKPKEEVCCVKLLQIQNQPDWQEELSPVFRLKNQMKTKTKTKNPNPTQNQKTTTPRKTYLTTVILVILEISTATLEISTTEQGKLQHITMQK